MTVIILIPLLVCIAGILLYALTTNANLKEIGCAMMWCGMLVSLFAVAGHTFKF